MQGKTQKPMTEAIAGDIVAVAKVEDLHIGDTIATNANAPKLPKPSFPTPMFGLAVEPKARGDEQKISGSLQKIADEDPTFKMTRDTQTKEMVITGMSQLHLDVVQHRLKRRFELEMITKEPKIPYRETITSPPGPTTGIRSNRAAAASSAKSICAFIRSRTSRHPQRGRILREVRQQEQVRKDPHRAHYDAGPQLRASSITSSAAAFPISSCLQSRRVARKLLERGALAGYRIQDVAVEVHFGKDHPVDSSEAAFKTAGRMAFKNAFREARPVLSSRSSTWK